jgi:hypothetical protein
MWCATSGHGIFCLYFFEDEYDAHVIDNQNG